MINLNFLIPKEKIVGIEINSQKMRMLYLELDRNGKAIVKGQSETEINEEDLSFEKIKDIKKISSALNKLKNDFKPQKFFSSFAILTIPQNEIYSEIMKFPAALSEDQLIESIGLNASENLPLPLSECYIDWQIIESNNKTNSVLISIISRKIADNYIKILKENGFKLIALEASFLSIERAIFISEKPTIFLYLTDEGITSIIYKNKLPYFSQFESWNEITAGKEIKNMKDLSKVIKNKVKKLILYLESRNDKMKIEKILLASYGFDADIIIKKVGKALLPIEKAELKIKSLENNDWISVAGAAARAFIPRSDDKIISLLPIGTESLYETQKAVSFIKSIMTLVFSLAIFYIAIFSGSYLFISTLEKNINSQISIKNNLSLPEEYIKIKSETEEFNSYAKDLAKIYPETKSDYDDILKNINKFNIPGISIIKLNSVKQNEPVYISGIASTRENLNVFRSKIENSNLFENTKFSVKNIAQKENIIFEMRLVFKKK